MKDDAARKAGRALGGVFIELARKVERRTGRMDAILDAYIRSGVTGRTYEEERNDLLRERGLGTIDE